MRDSLILIAKEFLRGVGKENYIENEDLIEVSLSKSGVLCVNWNSDNYNFFICSDGSWSWEDRDNYKAGKTLSPKSRDWLEILEEERGWSKEDSFDAVNSWNYMIKKLKYCKEI